jgi:filamentous hemagglutinin family protein
MKSIRCERGRNRLFARKAIFIAIAALFGDMAVGQTLPTGGTVATGNGTATVTTTGSAMTVTQATSRALIDWTSFSIGSGGSVTFVQPSSSAIAVNRVGLGGGASAIDGALTANGNVMILNPNGVMFGPTATVNVAGLVASTGNVNDAQFMSGGSFAISGASGGSVSNAATPTLTCPTCGITVTGAGLAAFVAPSISNSGTITASGGRIVLASAQAATVSYNGGLYEIAIDQGVAAGSIDNTGKLDTGTTSGTIVLSALDAANLVSGVINLSGIQQANRIEVNGGHVVLASDLNAATVTGASRTVDVVKGPATGGQIQDGIEISASGGTVDIGAGTFSEQLRVSKSLSLVGAGQDATIIRPTSLAADAQGMRSILTIGGGPATNVEVSGLQLKGPVPEINAGIFVRDGAHANIHDNKLIDMRESAALSGNQRGIGIFVGRALLGTSGTALIERNIITGYQKGGIVVDGPGSQATIRGNTITGEGPTNVTAQNGIQASRGASADISGNDVSGNDYTPASDDATGILIFTPGANLAQGTITVGPNNVHDNEVGIDTNDPRTLATISLSGVTRNGRNAVAEFGGGFAGAGALLEFPAWAAPAATRADALAFAGKAPGDIVDVGGGLRVYGWSGFTAIQPAIDAVVSGGRVDVGAGTYAQSATLNVHKSITLAGAGESMTTIDARTVSGYGILVDADHVSLSGFTLYGPTANSSSSYGIKVQPAGSAASSRVRDFRISNVTTRGAFKAELDLNGVAGATIDHVTADGAPVGNDTGTTAGAGIQITDSSDVVIRNSTTLNNAWGGVALFQSNRFFDQQTTNISVEGNNNLTETLPLYLQDESAALDFGALNIQGFGFAVRNDASPDSRQFTWLQKTLANAIAFANSLPMPASSTVHGWSGAGVIPLPPDNPPRTEPELPPSVPPQIPVPQEARVRPQILVPPPIQVPASTNVGLPPAQTSPVADFVTSLPAPRAADAPGAGGGNGADSAPSGGNGPGPGPGGRAAPLVTAPVGTGTAPVPRSTPNRATESLDRGRSVEIDLSPGQ